MLKSDLARKLSSNVATINQALKQLGRTDLIPGKYIPDDLAQEFLNAVNGSTGTQTNPSTGPQPEPHQPEQPAPEMGGALAETQSEQLTESRQKVDAILPDLEKLVLQKVVQSGVASADLHSLAFDAAYEARWTDNQLARTQRKIGQLNNLQSTVLEDYDPFKILEDLGITNPAQAYEALCEYKRHLETPINPQSVPVDAMGKSSFQEKLEALKAAFRGS